MRCVSEGSRPSTHRQVDDKLDLWDVQTARGNIRGNQHGSGPDLKASKLRVLCSCLRSPWMLATRIPFRSRNCSLLARPPFCRGRRPGFCHSCPCLAVLHGGSSRIDGTPALWVHHLHLRVMRLFACSSVAPLPSSSPARVLPLIVIFTGLIHETGLGEALDTHGPGSREHESACLFSRWAGVSEDQFDILLESLIQHAIGLVEDSELTSERGMQPSDKKSFSRPGANDNIRPPLFFRQKAALLISMAAPHRYTPPRVPPWMRWKQSTHASHRQPARGRYNHSLRVHRPVLLGTAGSLGGREHFDSGSP